MKLKELLLERTEEEKNKWKSLVKKPFWIKIIKPVINKLDEESFIQEVFEESNNKIVFSVYNEKNASLARSGTDEFITKLGFPKWNWKHDEKTSVILDIGDTHIKISRSYGHQLNPSKITMELDTEIENDDLDLNEFLSKGGYEHVSFYAVRNAVENFIRDNYTSGRELRGLDNIAQTIQRSINSELYSLESFYKKYDGSMTEWVKANESWVRDLIFQNM